MTLSERRKDEEFSKTPKYSKAERKRVMRRARRLLKRLRAEKKSNEK
jgi:predicted Fe-S protein YdhL (DUF1289 family)